MFVWNLFLALAWAAVSSESTLNNVLLGWANFAAACKESLERRVLEVLR